MITENPCERRKLADSIGRDVTTAHAWLSWHASAASALVPVPVYAYNRIAYHLEQHRAPQPDAAKVKAYTAWCYRQLERIHTDPECDLDALSARWGTEAANSDLYTVRGLDLALAITGALAVSAALLTLGGAHMIAIAALFAAIAVALYVAVVPRVPAVGPDAPKSGIHWLIGATALSPRRPVGSHR